MNILDLENKLIFIHLMSKAGMGRVTNGYSLGYVLKRDFFHKDKIMIEGHDLSKLSESLGSVSLGADNLIAKQNKYFENLINDALVNKVKVLITSSHGPAYDYESFDNSSLRKFAGLYKVALVSPLELVCKKKFSCYDFVYSNENLFDCVNGFINMLLSLKECEEIENHIMIK